MVNELGLGLVAWCRQCGRAGRGIGHCERPGQLAASGLANSRRAAWPTRERLEPKWLEPKCLRRCWRIVLTLPLSLTYFIAVSYFLLPHLSFQGRVVVMFFWPRTVSSSAPDRPRRAPWTVSKRSGVEAAPSPLAPVRATYNSELPPGGRRLYQFPCMRCAQHDS